MDLIQESTFLAAVNEHLIHRETNSLNNKGGRCQAKICGISLEGTSKVQNGKSSEDYQAQAHRPPLSQGRETHLMRCLDFPSSVAHNRKILTFLSRFNVIFHSRRKLDM